MYIEVYVITIEITFYCFQCICYLARVSVRSVSNIERPYNTRFVFSLQAECIKRQTLKERRKNKIIQGKKIKQQIENQNNTIHEIFI